ncbi:hypothetical protein [Solimicrobium silvestre]|uniref:Uncharacterized protein n=1 Tax=Solimicrobium silvestre TaxID=2099400 RepID=A0A2S9H2J8_9BURK|nr:hypothetical protein [Solimicrobium silvestre]PRC94204.1 hypothetical protein S2091_0825 [Solimicrobium silvestre]
MWLRQKDVKQNDEDVFIQQSPVAPLPKIFSIDIALHQAKLLTDCS